jgi:hypothetical protein
MRNDKTNKQFSCYFKVQPMNTKEVEATTECPSSSSSSEEKQLENNKANHDISPRIETKGKQGALKF